MSKITTHFRSDGGESARWWPASTLLQLYLTEPVADSKETATRESARFFEPFVSQRNRGALSMQGTNDSSRKWLIETLLMLLWFYWGLDNQRCEAGHLRSGELSLKQNSLRGFERIWLHKTSAAPGRVEYFSFLAVVQLAQLVNPPLSERLLWAVGARTCDTTAFRLGIGKYLLRRRTIT